MKKISGQERPEKCLRCESLESLVYKHALKQSLIHAQLLETYIKKFIEATGLPLESLALIEDRREDGSVAYYMEEKPIPHMWAMSMISDPLKW